MTSPLPTANPNHWNNFLWALAAPDIAPAYTLPWLPQSRRLALTQFFSQEDTRAQLEPELLLHIQEIQSRRLGIYFESLWAFGFSRHPDYELLAHNFPIRDRGKTLGELDFVVRHIPDKTIEHWEVALKFYLQVDDYWVGPGLRDRLDIKLNRMRDHQLPVARSPLAADALSTAGLHIDRQWSLMPGRLFRPLSAAASGADAPWWADLATFYRHLSTPRAGWQLLPKPCWLAPQPAAQGTVPLVLDETHLAYGPVCVALCSADGESSRGFLVPADWLERARSAIEK